MTMIIFLDIDGVIATSKSYKEYPDKDDLLDRRCMQALNYLCKTLNAKVVISSTWRMEGLEALRKKFEFTGFKGEIIGLTPNLIDEKLYARRGTEILRWLEQNKYEGEYIVLDDEIFDIKNDIAEFRIHHIENGFRKRGLTIQRADKIVKYVRENTPVPFSLEDRKKEEAESEAKREGQYGIWYKLWDAVESFYYSLDRIHLFKEIKYAIQRIKRGWSDRDVWSFEGYLAEVIRDGLKHLKQNKYGVPTRFLKDGDDGPQNVRIAERDWNATLDEIILAYDTALKIMNGDVYAPFEGEDARGKEKKFLNNMHELGHTELKFLTVAEYAKMKEGFKLFGEHFFSFWD